MKLKHECVFISDERPESKLTYGDAQWNFAAAPNGTKSERISSI